MYNHGDRVRIKEFDEFSLFCPSLNFIPEEVVKQYAGQIVTVNRMTPAERPTFTIDEDGEIYAWPVACAELVEAFKPKRRE